MRIGPRQAVVVCHHVFEGATILKAVREQGIDSADSGWQCHCNQVDHTRLVSAKIVTVEELLLIEPTLAPFIDLPVGTVLERHGDWEEWQG